MESLEEQAPPSTRPFMSLVGCVQPGNGGAFSIGSLPVNEQEEWRKVVGFPDYSVSNLGRVKRDTAGTGAIQGRILKPYLYPNGYLGVVFCVGNKTKKYFVHRVVATAFIPNPSGLPVINHKEGKKQDNRPSQLEWTTPKGNAQHASEHGFLASGVRHGSRTHPEKIRRGEKHGMVKLNEAEVAEIRNEYASGRSQPSLAEEFKVNDATISKIVLRKIWRHIP